MAARLFGTDGVRGLANKELTAELALDLSVAAAHVLGEVGAFKGHRPQAVVGRDPRASGEFLTAATIAIAVFTVLSILNLFSVFDFMKPYTYSAYRLAFVNLFRYPIYWRPIGQALLTYVLTSGAALAAAWLVFSRKDIVT